ncbi:MAG TPA: TOMM precursor leader peptide-binding protein [Solirubrobacteraceae bacterium]
MTVDTARIPTQPRLAPDVEAFPASDGHVYVLRGGPEPDLVIEDAGPRERALLALLAEGETPAGEFAARLDVAAPGGDGTLDVMGALGALAAHGLLQEAAPASRASGLTTEERARYDRQLPYLASAGRDAETAQLRLRDARVTILGVGGLGSWTLCGLACAGVGHVRIVDHDTIELSNLNRQLLYRRDDVGRKKVDVAAEAIAAFNPSIVVEPIAERASGPDDVARAVEGADVVVATADWPMYDLARWVNRACLAADVSWIAASQVPPLVRIGPTHVPGRTGCMECQERAGRRAFELYDELAEWRQAHPTVATTLGWASGVIGSLLAGEVIHQLTGVTEPATTGTAITIDLRTLEVRRERVERDPDCPLCS